MNLERFHAAIYELRLEIDREKIIEKLSSLRDLLQQSISQQTPEAANAFKEAYKNIASVLMSSKSNTAFPTRKLIYKEISCEKYFGNGLLKTLNEIVNNNQLTPANAVIEINNVLEKTSAYHEKIRQQDKLFEELEVEYSEIDPGGFEVGVSIPRRLLESNLSSLEKEFHKLNFALKTLNEVSSSSHGELELKTISASDWQVYFNAGAEMAACLAFAIERIVALYKSNLEIKVLKNQLENKSLPEKIIQEIQIHIDESVTKELRVIAEGMVEKFCSESEERKNELKNQTSQALKYIADRLDNGAIIEANARPPDPPKPTVNAESGEKLINEDEQKLYKELLETARNINKATALIEEIKESSGPVLSIDYKDET